MEIVLVNNFLNQEIQLRCVDGAIYEGELSGVSNNVAILEREGRNTFIACDKIVAAWSRDAKDSLNPTIGFIGA